MTFDDIAGLTAGQRTKLELFRQIGLQIRAGVAKPDISGVTDSQAKAAAQWLRGEAKALLSPTEDGVRHVREVYAAASAKAYEDSVIPGP